MVSTSAATSSSSWAATSPSGRSRHVTRAPGASSAVARRSSSRRTAASRSGGCVGECGCDASPAVAVTTSTCRPVAAAVCSRPPAPSVSSSGWAPTTITRRTAGRSTGGALARDGVHDAAGVPGRSWRKSGPVTSSTPGRRGAGGRGRPGRARRATGAGRARGRPPGVRASSSVARGPGPSPCAVRRRTSSQAVATTSRTRRAACQPAGPESSPASSAAAACSSAARAPWSRVSTAPRCISATWSGSRDADAAASRLATPTAPPNHTAATPMAPHAKPGRSRYQPGAPTGRAVTPSRSRGPESTALSPRATQVPGSAVTPGWSRSTAKSCRSSPTRALIRAWSRTPPSEHQCLRPSSTYDPPRGVARSGSPGPSAAKTPHVPSPGCSPACARMAWASTWGSRHPRHGQVDRGDAGQG